MSDLHKISPAPAGAAARERLSADCGSCFGLCCTALRFSASADFAADKAAGQPCPNLQPDFRCGVHTRLRELGFRGCTVFDCFGAGQFVSQETFGGVSWREAPETAEAMFAVFPVMHQLHELLWYLEEARSLQAAEPLAGALAAVQARVEACTQLPPGELRSLDVAALRGDVNELLLRSSELARSAALRALQPQPGRRKAYGRGADLIGARLRGADLRALSLRGAYLIAADLRGASLQAADLIGADLRDADLSGADLTGAIFLTQAQLNAAKGDAGTRLPPAFTRPPHWTV
ncbi:pentapeptide repeat-containing protein ['Paenibacillus yunnanensis' Narsing Rao et al. 2020]|uniref:pentapeptide repeat-containing protein n=1 Tax=Paenibacillus tengchongensis TaxID=2608684 RepID=UPI00124D8ECC|nr:pentapeptide repeat-containing protein [Paenibacillus tengchongensis]